MAENKVVKTKDGLELVTTLSHAEVEMKRNHLISEVQRLRETLAFKEKMLSDLNIATNRKMDDMVLKVPDMAIKAV